MSVIQLLAQVEKPCSKCGRILLGNPERLVKAAQYLRSFALNEVA